MKSRSLRYFAVLAAFALLSLTGCSGGGGNVTLGEKGTSLTVNGQVGEEKSLAKSLFAVTDPMSGTVSVLNAADASVLGTTTISSDGSFSGLSFTLPSTKTVLVFKAVTNKSTTPFYTIVPIDLSQPPPAGISASNAISILITQASTNIAATVSSMLGLSGVLGETGNSTPTGQDFTSVAKLVTQYGGQVLAYNTGGLALMGSLNETLLPAQDANTLTGDQLNAIVLDGAVTGVAIPGNNPIISFQVTNKATGKGIRGLNKFSFTIAQLKPGANGSPNEWLSYMLTPSGTTPGRPLYETSGYTVLDNGDGSYTVKLAKDIKNVTNAGAGVTYDANLTHRVAILVRSLSIVVADAAGNAVNPSLDRTTGAVLNSNFKNEKLLFSEFIPATPSVTPTEQRSIIKKEACEACHTKLGITTPHNIGFSDVRLCVMCHTSQRANGRTNTASVDGAFTGSTYIADGVVIGEFVTLIHKIHMGEELKKTGYNFAGVLFNEVIFPQPVTNCRTCHIEDTSATTMVPQSLNWKTNPSRKACGACHDNVNFATGEGHEGGAQSDDVNCATCHSVTSTILSPDVVHKPVVPPDPNNIYLGGTSGNTHASWMVGSQTNLPAGVHAIAYDVKSVDTVANATDPTKMNPSITFKLKKDGADVIFPTYDAATAPELISGYVGSPSVYFAWSVPQGDIAAPADYNATASTYIKNMWRGDGKDVKGVALSATAQGTMTGPSTDGYYTVTLTGIYIPAEAKMLTGGLGYSYSLSATQPLTQIDVAAYPYTPNSERLDPAKTDGSKVNAGVGGIGGISVPSPNVFKVATGYTGRRLIVSAAKCNGCHSQLGIGPSFHAGQRNNPQSCTFCHNTTRATGHTSTGGGGWSINMKDMIHGIHGAKKRSLPFTWEATTTNPLGFGEVLYPAILNNCEQCHLAGMYDFSSTAYSAATMTSLLWSTGASSTMPTTPGPAMSPYVTAGTAYGAGFSYNANTGVTTLAAGTNLVHSPITAACFSCHDSSTAQAHMRTNGGSIYAVRSTIGSFGITNEQCLVCHGAGKVVDIKLVHRP